MQILTDTCFNCSACMFVCPREAIAEDKDETGQLIYTIDSAACTEGEDEEGPRCRAECPIPECIVRFEA